MSCNYRVLCAQIVWRRNHYNDVKSICPQKQMKQRERRSDSRKTEKIWAMAVNEWDEKQSFFFVRNFRLRVLWMRKDHTIFPSFSLHLFSLTHNSSFRRNFDSSVASSPSFALSFRRIRETDRTTHKWLFVSSRRDWTICSVDWQFVSFLLFSF